MLEARMDITGLWVARSPAETQRLGMEFPDTDYWNCYKINVSRCWYFCGNHLVKVLDPNLTEPEAKLGKHNINPGPDPNSAKC